jgi:hypothetical protein
MLVPPLLREEEEELGCAEDMSDVGEEAVSGGGMSEMNLDVDEENLV